MESGLRKEQRPQTEMNEKVISDIRRDTELNKSPLIRNQGRYTGCPLLVSQWRVLLQAK